MDTNWYKNVNPQLNKLAALLDMGEKPSHGYTIAEKAPEVVTAPGVYFPAEKGEVIPIEPKADGGSVTPSLNKDNDRARLEMLNSIISMVKPSRLESRQFGGSVIPPQGELERLGIEQSKYDILKNAIAALKPTGRDRPSYNERTSRYGSPSGTSAFSTKSTEPDLYDRLKAASGSPDMTPSMPKPPEIGGYPMKPDIMKDDYPDLNSVPMESRQMGGTVWPPTPESLELEKRRLWETPGYSEQALAEAQKVSPDAIAVSPGYERGYYEAHPEERIMEGIEEANKPAMESAQKLIEEARTRAGGFGLMGMSPKEAALARKQATANIPVLQKSLADIGASTATAKEGVIRDLSGRGKAMAPHLVQDASGQYVWATPGGVMPAGIGGRMPAEDVSEWRTFEKMGEEKGWNREKTLEEWNKVQVQRTGQKAGATLQGQQEAVLKSISEDAWDQAVESYTAKGVLPFEISRMAYRYPLVSTEIYRRAREKGFTGTEAAVREAAYKGMTTEFQTTARRKAATLYFEGMLKQNTDALEQQNLQVIRTKYPKINNLLLWAEENAGNPDVTAFKTQLGRVAVEWAKLTSGSLGMAEVSVQAQRNMDALLNASKNIEQLQGLIQTIRMDAGHAANSIYMREEQQRNDVYELTGKLPTAQEPKYKTKKIKVAGMEIETKVPNEMVESISKGGTNKPTKKESGGTIKRLPNESIADYLKRTGGM